MSGKRQPLGVGRWVILLLCAIVFCGCLAYLGMWAQDSMTAQKDFKEVSEQKEMGLEEVYALNTDVIGWITIEGTRIDYPVMQTVDEPEFYLHSNFKKEYSESGTPFLDAKSRVGKDPTWNWFIYSHNMKFGTMFHDLLEYDSADFWKEHSTVDFQVISEVKDGEPIVEDGKYEIFAAARSRIKEKDSKEFKYYHYTGFDDEESFNAFVKGVKKEALYDTGITPEFGDQLITLSTCAYHVEDGRFYVVAVRKNF